MVTTSCVIRARSSSKFAGKVEKKNFVFEVSTHRKVQGVLNQAIVVAKLSFHHDQSKQPHTTLFALGTSIQLHDDWQDF